MKKYSKNLLVMVCIALILGSFAGCSQNVEGGEKLNTTMVKIEALDSSVEQEDVSTGCFANLPVTYEKYEKLTTYIMNLDSALNTDMTYIALNFDFEVSEESKQLIFDALSKYEVEIFESEIDLLMDQEYSDDYGNLYGIHINFNSIEVSNHEVISFTKYRSGLGSISTEVMLKMNENGEWELIESDAPVVSS